jgi:hypothetical protein
MTKFKYAIKKIKKKNGDLILIPMAKQVTKLISLGEWQRIIKLYDTFDTTTSYLDTDFKMSLQDCMDHIDAYKKIQDELSGDVVETIEMVLESDLNNGLKIAL